MLLGVSKPLVNLTSVLLLRGRFNSKFPAIFVLIPTTYFYCFILVTEGPPAMYCLLEIVAVAREKLASQFVKHLDWIKVMTHLH